LIKGWSISSREGDLASVWDKSSFRSWPWKSINIFISKVLDVLVDSFFADIFTISIEKNSSDVLWGIFLSVVESGMGLGNLWVKGMNLLWSWV
jgi:hypothetical protein